MNEHGQKLADIGAPFAWVAWFFSHMQQVNQVLQMIALIAAIFASIAAGIFHIAKWRRMSKSK